MVDAVTAHRASSREFTVSRIVKLCNGVTAARHQYSPIGQQRRRLPVTAFCHVSGGAVFFGMPVE
jgi:hypothetical protein